MSKTSSQVIDATATKLNTATVDGIKTSANISLVYVGPSLSGGMLSQFTVFRGGKPKHLSQLFTDCPAIAKLLVPVEKLSDQLEKIAKPGTPQHTWYNQVGEFIQKKGVK